MNHDKALTAQSKKAAPGPAVAPTGGFAGRWKNEYGSYMDLTEINGTLTGEYTSKVSSTGAETKGDLVGFVNDDIISFVVKWRDFSSITAWVGQIVDLNGTETIKTLWHLVRNIMDAEEPTGLWTTILTGNDEFSR